jgi:RNA polymerase sigma factor (sigma-70 family)
MTEYKQSELTKLTYTEVIRNIEVYQTTGDIDARNKVVESYTLLAQKASRKYGMTHRESMDDLLHTGIMGIIAAIDKFDISVGSNFSSYCYQYIDGYMKNRLNVKFNRCESLSTKVFGEDSGTTRQDQLVAEVGATDSIERDESYGELHNALTELSDRDRQVIELYFGFGCEKQTMQAIADGLGVSKMGVQKIITRSLSKLKNLIG